ncbi:MAG TPA: NAD(P)-dependent oxidoreductase [Myxococcales bacterium]|nr:NAD(P)-dependent oxidoreductase [Myxococcales bacterium]
MADLKRHKLGWIGIGRMGFPMAERLLKKGADLAVYNRTRAKAEPLAARGARIVDSPAALADRDIVFTMVSASPDLLEVVTGPSGVLSRPGCAPRILVDCSTVSQEASVKARAAAAEAGCALLAAPVSGNGKVVKAGRLSLVVSGSRAAFDEALPYLESLGEGVSYVGEGELARTVKICHNVFLGVIAQSLAEITVLAEKAGVQRHAFLDFINKSVLGSTFTRYKTPAYVNLDFAPTFTPVLLRKDLDLGLAAARSLEVPMPVAAAVREIVQGLIGNGYVDCDFAALLELEAKAAHLPLKPENVPVSDGLEPRQEAQR